MYKSVDYQILEVKRIPQDQGLPFNAVIFVDSYLFLLGFFLFGDYLDLRILYLKDLII